MRFTGISLVTGAAGFMGSHVVECLVEKGVQVRATSRQRKDLSFFDRLGVEYIPADLTDPESLPGLFTGNVDRVFHLGAICNFSTPYVALHTTNVEGVKHITRLALAKGIKRFVHVTSTSVYGAYTGQPFSEGSLRLPIDDYGRSKLNGEDVVFGRMEEGLPTIIARPCTVYGPRCNDGAGKVFSRPSAITAIPGTGRQRLSNIRAEDVAEALIHLSEMDEAVGNTYNMADNTHPTVEAALLLAATVFGTPHPRIHLPLPVVRAAARIDGWISKRKGRIPDLEYDATRYLADDYIVDNSRLLSTGFQFRYPDFKASMRQMGEWYEAQQA